MGRTTEDLEDFLDEEVEEQEESKDSFDATQAPAAAAVKDKYSAAMAAYFAELKRKCDEAYRVAGEARKQGWEPEVVVEVPQSEDLASRVENLLAPAYPFVRGVAPKIRELSAKHNREEVSLLVAKAFAAELAPKEGKEAAVDGAVRVGLAILTEGVLVAPLEGILKVSIGENQGSATDPQFVAVHYAGPIRAAGGTAQALSVLIADVVRRELGIGRYIPTEPEVERLKEEIPAYKQSAHLQVLPTAKEIELIAKGCPVMIDGEGTEDQEISGNRDQPRIETNRLRGGACLVMAEGLILKATKVQKHVKNLKIGGWEWLDAFVNKKKDGEEDGKEKTPLEAATGPNPKYLEDLVAGRPVFAGPARKGGFRLRYGRARTAGIASTAIHPATMTLVEEFLAVGTQMKIERPGKATVCTPCDTIEGPLVILDNGDYIQLTSAKQAAGVAKRVRRIIDLGEILVPFGEFAENNKPLMPAGYCREWWNQEVSRKLPAFVVPTTSDDAVRFSAETGLPLHPDFTLFWHDLSPSQVLNLREQVLGHGHFEGPALVVPADAQPLLLELGCLYRKRPTNEVVVEKHTAALLRCLGLEPREGAVASRVAAPAAAGEDVLALVSALAGFPVRAKSPYRIGARMGRPEKALERKMSPPVHALFPIGQAGGLQRLVKDAATKSPLSVEVGLRTCPQCREQGIEARCGSCGAHTQPRKTEGRVEPQRVDLREMLQQAAERMGLGAKVPDVKAVQGLISKHKVPEPLEKGLLRAKHDVSVFKDGTVRFDMTDVPLTHFKPREVHTSVARLRELGYTHDCKGQPLERDDQVLELRVQDVIVPHNGLVYLVRTAQFVDELLEKLYGLPPFYRAKQPEDLVGHLVVGLAPHTSGGILGRVVGWTRTQAGLAHPYWHAAKRRNCVEGSARVRFLAAGSKVVDLSLAELFEKSEGPEIAADELGATFKHLSGLETVAVDARSGKVSRHRVSRVYRMPGRDHVVQIRTESGHVVRCSSDHALFRLVGGVIQKKKALELSRGDRVIVKPHGSPPFLAPVGDVTTDGVVEVTPLSSGDRWLYDLEVDTHHNYFVDDGLLVSNCDGDEDCIMLLLDGLLNFSRQFLPEKRGGLMDAPLVLTTRLDPSEIDKEAHNLDCSWIYPLEFYEATQRCPSAKEVDKLIDSVGKRLGSEGQYEGLGFTHDTTDIGDGPVQSSYKTLPTMRDKMDGQFRLAERLRAVDARDVASRVLEGHFLRDLQGNLKKFSKQKVRCVKCNAKYRRPPLKGACLRCGSSLTMTVHHKSVIKYLEVSKEISAKYDVKPYTKQRLAILEDNVASLFQSDKVKKTSLRDFFG